MGYLYLFLDLQTIGLAGKVTQSVGFVRSCSSVSQSISKITVVPTVTFIIACFWAITIARRGLNVKVISQGQRSVKCACYTMSLLLSLCFVPYVYPGGPVCRGQQTASQPLSLVVISNIPDKMCKVIWHEAAPACPFSWGVWTPSRSSGLHKSAP